VGAARLEQRPDILLVHVAEVGVIPYKVKWVDFVLFLILFAAMSTWSCGSCSTCPAEVMDGFHAMHRQSSSVSMCHFLVVLSYSAGFLLNVLLGVYLVIFS
jgi:hypothetical protein